MSQLSLGVRFERPPRAERSVRACGAEARTVAYDGTDFRGFAAQREQRTVEGVLTDALARVLRSPTVEVSCAGRTDAGVHAWGQVVSVPVDGEVDPDTIARSVNAQLGPRSWCAPPSWSTRPSTPGTPRNGAPYRYTIVNRAAPDPFLARYAWWVPEPLDLRRCALGADPFIGEHDFASFCRRGPEGSTTVRRVLDSSWVDVGDGVLRYEVRATAFCWQMVRSIVGHARRHRRREAHAGRRAAHPPRARSRRRRSRRAAARPRLWKSGTERAPRLWCGCP